MGGCLLESPSRLSCRAIAFPCPLFHADSLVASLRGALPEDAIADPEACVAGVLFELAGTFPELFEVSAHSALTPPALESRERSGLS